MLFRSHDAVDFFIRRLRDSYRPSDTLRDADLLRHRGDLSDCDACCHGWGCIHCQPPSHPSLHLETKRRVREPGDSRRGIVAGLEPRSDLFPGSSRVGPGGTSIDFLERRPERGRLAESNETLDLHPRAARHDASIHDRRRRLAHRGKCSPCLRRGAGQRLQLCLEISFARHRDRTVAGRPQLGLARVRELELCLGLAALPHRHAGTGTGTPCARGRRMLPRRHAPRNDEG